MPRLVLHNGDCVEVLKGYADGSIGAIVSDPPYGLEFMGKDWDRLSPGTPQESTGDVFHDPSVVGGFQDGAGGNPFSRSRIRYGRGQSMREWHLAWLREAYRILRPGGTIKAFSGSRTFHHLAYAVEQAGFVGVELEAWTYGSGFPKSHNVAVYLDRMLTEGKSRQILRHGIGNLNGKFAEAAVGFESQSKRHINQTDTAKAWEGWGTALKPAWEPVVVGRKPA